MKKEYVKPEMLAEEILLESMIAISGDNSQDFEDGETDGRGANEHRGGWGNLWD